MVFGTGTCFAGVGGKEPRHVFRLGERGPVEHDTGQEVGEEIVVLGVKGAVP
jgi:hypothetical protein